MIRSAAIVTVSLLGVFACDRMTTSGPSSCPAWTAEHSANIAKCLPDQFTLALTPEGKQEPHYITRKAPSALHGKTITFDFDVTGMGSLRPTDSDPPAKVTLYVEHKSGDLTIARLRWWSSPSELKTGRQSVSVKIIPDEGLWTSVSGERSDGFGRQGNSYANDFNRTVNEAGKLGFTFGGMFYGHGVTAVGGHVHFTLVEFTVK